MVKGRRLRIRAALALWLGACATLPDRDLLDEEGRFHDELVDRGSYEVFQHYGSAWRSVGYAWVGEASERTVWILRRAGTGGYPYRSPSDAWPEVWTRFRRLPADYEDSAALIEGEGIETARFYAIESSTRSIDLGQPVARVDEARPPAELGPDLDRSAHPDGFFALERDGRPRGYLWASGTSEVFLLPRESAVREAAARVGAGQADCWSRRRLGDAGASWFEALAAREPDPRAFEAWSCRCRAADAADSAR